MRDALPSRPPRPPGWLIARTRRLRVALRNGYVNRRTGQRLWPAHRLGYWWHAWRPRSRSRIHTELGWLPAGRQRRRLLDIGGQGPQAIGAARSSGWRVTVMLPDHRRPAWLDMPDVEDGSQDEVLVPDIPIPDIYSDPDPYEPTVPNLKVIDVNAPDSEALEGFDPYDTAVLRNQ